jgi:anti-sigma-K factor RskA
VGFLLGNAYAGEIQAVIVARDPDVRALVAALKTDLADISDVLTEQAYDLEAQRKVNLMLIRQGGRVDRLRLYSEYKAARQEVATQAALAVAVGQYADVLDQLAAAHAALASGAPDAALTIQRFVALTNDLVDLVAAVAKQDDKKEST